MVLSMETMRDKLAHFLGKVNAPAAIAAVTDAQAVVDIEVVGVRSRDEPTEATVNDLWHIGSCAKSMTAVLFACLVEAGNASWDTTVAELFEDLDDVDAGWTNQTVDDLFHCRAGAPANPPRSEMIRLHNTTEPVTDQRSQAAADIVATAPKNPGQFLYSNLSYIAIGAAIDRLAGMPYEEAMQRYVLDPLGIESAGVGPPPKVRGHKPRIVLGPMTIGRGRPVLDDGAILADNPPLFTPAGRFHLSMQDWARFQRVFLNDGEPLVSSDTLAHVLHVPSPQDKRTMSMGWAPGKQIGFDYGQQGSNTMWSASAVMDLTSRRTAMVIANDGRSKVLMGSAYLAAELLGSP